MFGLLNPMQNPGLLGGQGQAAPWATPMPAPTPGGGGIGFANNPMITALGASLLSSRGQFGPASQAFGQAAPAAMAAGSQMRQSEATKAALNKWLIAKSSGDPQALQTATSELMAASPEFGMKYALQSIDPKSREIRADPNNIPRYVDTGEPVFPGVDQKDTGVPGIFGGKSVEAQSLNYLISQGRLTAEQAAQLGAGRQVTGPDGTIYFATPEGIMSRPGGEAGAPAGAPDGYHAITGPKTYGTQEQTTAAGFRDRMETSGKIITENESEGTSLYSKGVSEKMPFGLGNYMVSSDYQKLDQAKRDFINAQLRRESGAVISPEEFDNANKQYFPQPGDGPEVLAQKRANRETALASMERSAGPLNPSKAGTTEDPLGIR